jgi:hypothetical protein
MKTPFELATGRQPNVGHFVTYGCRAYMHSLGDLEPARRDKLQPRAHIGYLVGYAFTGGYKIWSPSLNRIFITSDVLFDKTLFYDLGVLNAGSSIPIGDLI